MTKTFWAVALVSVGALTACSPSAPKPRPTITVTAPAPAATTAPAASSPAASPAGTAATKGSAKGAAAQPTATSVMGKARAALAAKGYSIPAGASTDALPAAIKSFQRDNGLAATGEADDAFWQAMTGAAASGVTAGAGGGVAAGAGGSTAVPGAAAPGGSAQSAGSAMSGGGSTQCSALFAAWDAAVASGRRGSRAAAQSAHDNALSAGCNPDKWLPSSMVKVYDPGTHSQHQPCSMAEIGHYDGAGLVCTQDVENWPHWN